MAVFRPAILHNAVGLIVAHNHPSGDPTPSGGDRELTERLGQAGRLLCVAVLDHIVVGHGASFSFTEGRVLR